MRKYALLVLVCGLAVNAYCQDLHFSQYYETPLLRNPGLAGAFKGDYRVQMVYRNQWASVTNPYQTASLNGEIKIPVRNSNDIITVGLQALMDRAGTVALTSTHFLPAVNYSKALNDERSYLSLGFMGGLVSRRLDRSKITTNNQYVDGFGYNGSLPDGETFANNYSFFDASVGMSFISYFGEEKESFYYGGLAYHHFNKPGNSFYRNIQHFPKWVASAGVRASMGDMAYITLSVDASMQGSITGNQRHIIGGTLYSRKIDDSHDPAYILHLGSFIRWNDALIPVVKLDYNNFSLGFSYDMNISQLRTASQSRGGFEFSLTYSGFLNRYRSPY